MNGEENDGMAMRSIYSRMVIAEAQIKGKIQKLYSATMTGRVGLNGLTMTVTAFKSIFKIWRNKMLTCRICGCICDPSDLVNGICDDCRTEQTEKAEKQERLAQMMSGECEQMELRSEG